MANAIHPLVLYIEDDEEDQELCRFALEESQMNIDMQFISDGQTAMDYLDQLDSPDAPCRPPRLVLLDLSMPAVNGWDLLRYIRSRPRLRCIPVVVFTTSNAPRDIRQAYEEGANAYMVKPAGMEALGQCFSTTMQYWLQTVAAHG